MSKIRNVLLIAALAPSAMVAQFSIPGIPQIVWDPHTEAQMAEDIKAAIQLINLETQTQAIIQNSVASFRNGNGWQGTLSAVTMIAALGLNVASAATASDNLKRLNQTIQLANMAAQEATMWGHPPSTSNAALLSLLAIQQTMTAMQRDSLMKQMQWQADVQNRMNTVIPRSSNFDASAGGWVPK
jgi:hypothetical protein